MHTCRRPTFAAYFAVGLLGWKNSVGNEFGALFRNPFAAVLNFR